MHNPDAYDDAAMRAVPKLVERCEDLVKSSYRWHASHPRAVGADQTENGHVVHDVSQVDPARASASKARVNRIMAPAVVPAPGRDPGIARWLPYPHGS